MLFCEECGTKKEGGERFCSNCGVAFPQTSQSKGRTAGRTVPARTELQYKTAPPEGIGGIPFEQRHIYGFWAAFSRTWVLASTKPDEFYPMLANTQDIFSGIIFFLAISFFSLLISFLPFIAIFGSFSIFSVGLSFLLVLYIMLILLISLPMMLIGTYVGTWIFHIILSLVGGGPQGFSTTLLTVYYASAPSVIPIIGPLWSFIMIFIGLAHAHQVEIWRPIVAFFLSFFIIGLIFLIFVGLLRML